MTNNLFRSPQDTNIGFLFDLDGVLIDSEKEYTKIWAEINRVFPTGLPDLPIRIKGMTLVEIIDTYFPGKQEEVSSLLYELERKMKYEWLPGAHELLFWLKNNDIPTALVTSSNDIKMQHLREELPDLESLFTAIVTGDKVSKSKPDPEGYLLGADLLKCKPSNCVVFEDSLQGVKAGKASGAYVIGIEGTLSDAIISPFSDIVIKSLKQINVEELIRILTLR